MMKKFGTGDLTDVEKTERALNKEAVKESFTDEDAKALDEENIEADG